MKAAAIAVCLLFLSGLLAGCTPFGGQAANRGTIRVLALGSFTAGADSPGAYIRNALTDEAGQLNASGGVLGYKVAVVSSDDGGDSNADPGLITKAAMSASLKLVVGAPPVSGMANDQGVLAGKGLLACSSTALPESALAASPAVFSIESQEQEAAALLAYAVHTQHIQRIGLIATADAGGQAMDRALASQAGGAGATYLGAQLIPAGTIGQSAPIRKLVNQRVGAIVLSQDPVMAARTAMAVHALGLNPGIELLGFSSLASYPFAQLGGDGASGTVVAALNSSVLTPLAAARWAPNYRNLTHNLVNDYGTALDGITPRGDVAAADCLSGWARAAAQAGTLSPGPVAKAWARLHLSAGQDVLGMTESYSGHVALRASSMFIYKWALQGGHWYLDPLGV